MNRDEDRRVAALPGGLLDGRTPDDAFNGVARDWDRFRPTLGDAVGALDGYAWHPLYEDAVSAVEKAYETYGALEAMARATELRDLFDEMCAPSPWGWLG